MGKKMNQKGFGAVEAFLILVIIGIIGGAGWYVMKANKNIDDTNKKTITIGTSALTGKPKSSSPIVQKSIPKDSDNWLLVESTGNKYKLNIPDGWKLTKDTSSDQIVSSTDPNDITYSKGTKATITTREFGGTDAPLRFIIFTADAPIKFIGSTPTQSEFINDAGIKGSKYFETHGPREANDIGPGPIEGQKSYDYEFLNKGKYVRAEYQILPGDPNNLQYVELALKTLKF
jgi:hypothetical protein